MLPSEAAAAVLVVCVTYVCTSPLSQNKEHGAPSNQLVVPKDPHQDWYVDKVDKLVKLDDDTSVSATRPPRTVSPSTSGEESNEITSISPSTTAGRLR